MSEQECFDQVKRLVSFIPWNNQERAKVVEPKEPSAMLNIEQVVPADPKQPYDVRDVIRCIVDDSDFLEIQELWAANIVIGFGRMAGETVGFVANQPMVLAGVLDCDSADKAARFIRFCDSFNIPIITLEDMPGYLPGVDQEHAGVIRHGAKVLYAYSEATVPKITVILRKAYGGGYIAMNSVTWALTSCSLGRAQRSLLWVRKAQLTSYSARRSWRRKIRTLCVRRR